MIQPIFLKSLNGKESMFQQKSSTDQIVNKLFTKFVYNLFTLFTKFAKIPIEELKNNYSGGEIKKKKFYPFFRLKLKIN